MTDVAFLLSRRILEHAEPGKDLPRIFPDRRKIRLREKNERQSSLTSTVLKLGCIYGLRIGTRGEITLTRIDCSR